MLTLDTIEYQGWKNCLRLSNGQIQLIITTDVGPRIIHLGWTDSNDNLMFVNPETAGRTGDPEWNLYGGHRLWHAPEIKPRTYVPDNTPVQHEWDGATLTITADTEALTGLQKVVEITLDAAAPKVSLRHRLLNRGQWEVSAAPWALTVLAAGGTAIIPQEKFIPFPDALLPARPLVLWHYTNMADARFEWARDYIALQQDPAAKAPAKFGAQNAAGWGAYALNGTALLKLAALQPGATYPDYGCNWELYVNHLFLELETLGPLAPIAAGSEVTHDETWHLVKVKGTGNAELFEELRDAAGRLATG